MSNVVSIENDVLENHVRRIRSLTLQGQGQSAMDYFNALSTSMKIKVNNELKEDAKNH